MIVIIGEKIAKSRRVFCFVKILVTLPLLLMRPLEKKHDKQPDRETIKSNCGGTENVTFYEHV